MNSANGMAFGARNAAAEQKNGLPAQCTKTSWSSPKFSARSAEGNV
jgi:hypothetical protein